MQIAIMKNVKPYSDLPPKVLIKAFGDVDFSAQ